MRESPETETVVVGRTVVTLRDNRAIHAGDCVLCRFEPMEAAFELSRRILTRLPFIVCEPCAIRVQEAIKPGAGAGRRS